MLDAAERVMAEHGFEAATLARVVEEAGIPMSSVYHYFGSKTESCSPSWNAAPTASDGEVQAVVRQVREHALDLLRAQMAAAFGGDPRSPTTDQVACFALAAIDGAFVACQTDRGVTLERLLQPLAPALAASQRALLATPER